MSEAPRLPSNIVNGKLRPNQLKPFQPEASPTFHEEEHKSPSPSSFSLPQIGQPWKTPERAKIMLPQIGTHSTEEKQSSPLLKITKNKTMMPMEELAQKTIAALNPLDPNYISVVAEINKGLRLKHEAEAKVSDVKPDPIDTEPAPMPVARPPAITKSTDVKPPPTTTPTSTPLTSIPENTVAPVPAPAPAAALDPRIKELMDKLDKQDGNNRAKLLASFEKMRECEEDWNVLKFHKLDITESFLATQSVEQLIQLKTKCLDKINNDGGEFVKGLVKFATGLIENIAVSNAIIANKADLHGYSALTMAQKELQKNIRLVQYEMDNWTQLSPTKKIGYYMLMGLHITYLTNLAEKAKQTHQQEFRTPLPPIPPPPGPIQQPTGAPLLGDNIGLAALGIGPRPAKSTPLEQNKIEPPRTSNIDETGIANPFK